MPAQISSHFIITALADGSTVQGSLRTTNTLSQNYNPNISKCIPDWKADASLRPTIYAVVRKGTAYMSAAQIYSPVWLYNDVEIEWDDDNLSTNFLDASGSPLFQQGTTIVSLGGTTYSVPCLTIIANLASATNIDLDTIGLQGSVEISGKQSAFAAQVDVKIAQMTAQGFLGLLSPESMIITEKNQSVVSNAILYAEDGSQPATFYTKWYLNGSDTDESTLRGQKSIEIAEADVTDNLIVKCEFFTDSSYSNRVAVAFASVDDTQDPEFLYISLNNSSNDYSGQLSVGESVDVSMWVATMADSTDINTAYTSFAVSFYNGNEEQITTDLPTVTVTSNKGKLTIPYDFVANNGNKISGIVTAS